MGGRRFEAIGYEKGELYRWESKITRHLGGTKRVSSKGKTGKNRERMGRKREG